MKTTIATPSQRREYPGLPRISGFLEIEREPRATAPERLSLSLSLSVCAG